MGQVEQCVLTCYTDFLFCTVWLHFSFTVYILGINCIVSMQMCAGASVVDLTTAVGYNGHTLLCISAIKLQNSTAKLIHMKTGTGQCASVLIETCLAAKALLLTYLQQRRTLFACEIETMNEKRLKVQRKSDPEKSFGILGCNTVHLSRAKSLCLHSLVR